jgi:hypothetical protein
MNNGVQRYERSSFADPQSQVSEVGFKYGIVTDVNDPNELHLDEQFFGFRVLQDEQRVDYIPRTIGGCDSILMNIDMGEVGEVLEGGYGVAGAVHPGDRVFLKPGVRIHEHQYRDETGYHWSEYCIDRKILTPDAADSLILDSLSKVRERTLQRRLELMEIEAERFKSMEKIEPGEPFQLFEGAEMVTDSWGISSLEIPDRLFQAGEGRTPVIVRVRAEAFSGGKDWFFVSSDDKSRGFDGYYVRELYPLSDNAQPEPATEQLVCLEISVGNDNFFAHDLTEQKIILRIDGRQFTGEPDEEDQILTQGADGTWPNSYRRFYPEDQQGPFHYPQEPGGPARPNIRTGARIILPLDISTLSDIEAYFPGL